MNSVVVEVVHSSPEVRQLVARIHEESAVDAYAHIFTDPFPHEETQQRWNLYTGSLALASVEDMAVGFVAWQDEVEALYVLPSAAGCGVGGRLLDAAVGATRLWVLEDNRHARRFYERRGWSPSGHLRQQYGPVRELEYVRSSLIGSSRQS
ncbi:MULTISPECIES: GNAT family N-acetyltransferase [unclassified Luteococcus]|uniref:GNAT family N-acetyltransferase n=1 Tax=unclassified Luteococcus TaxID=2639923 RepID=UPI00313DA7B0